MLVPLPHPRPPVPAPATPGPGTHSTRSGWAQSQAPPFPGWGSRCTQEPHPRKAQGWASGGQCVPCRSAPQRPGPRPDTSALLVPPGLEGAQRLGLGQGWREPQPRSMGGAGSGSLEPVWTDGRQDRWTSGWLEAVLGGGEGWLKAEARGFRGLAEGAEPDPASAAHPAGSSWLAACSGVPGAAPGRRPRPCLPRVLTIQPLCGCCHPA